MSRKSWYLVGLLAVVLLSGCGSRQSAQMTSTQPLISDSVQHSTQVNTAPQPTPTAPLVIPRQVTTPTPVPTEPPISPISPPANVPVPTSGTGSAPYGPPPAPTAEEIQLTQKLFSLINSDRAARGLYPYAWNYTLAGGARLHSWNMAHCGFSHTCPDGLGPCARVINEGFAGATDCGECIGLAGPDPNPWSPVYAVQESMVNESPSGWHRIYLTSTTLHSLGVGLFVDARGWVWFTEDIVR